MQDTTNATTTGTNVQQQQPFRASISASNFYRRALCRGSYLAEQGIPDISNSNVGTGHKMTPALRGTFLHDKEFNEGASRADLLAHEVRALEKNKALSEAFVKSTFARLNIEDPGECKVYKENEFFLTCDGKQPISPPVPGHADEILYYPKHEIVFIFDSKFGRYPVTRAELNWQLRIYFLMALDDIGGKQFFVAIRQPYLQEPDDFHSAEYDAADAPAFRKEILDIMASCKEPDAPRCPSPDACNFCRARGTPRCPESAELVRDASRQQVLNLKPAQLEALGTQMQMAVKIAECWYEQMVWCISRYPQLFKQYELSMPMEQHGVVDNLAAFNLLYRKGIFGSNREQGLQEFIALCCKVSIPELTSLIAKKNKVEPKIAHTFLFEELGCRTEADPDNGGLIDSKWKQRSLKKLRGK